MGSVVVDALDCQRQLGDDVVDAGFFRCLVRWLSHSDGVRWLSHSVGQSHVCSFP